MSPCDPIRRQRRWRTHRFVHSPERPKRSQCLKISVGPASQRPDGTQKLVLPFETMKNSFASHLVLLRCEIERECVLFFVRQNSLWSIMRAKFTGASCSPKLPRTRRVEAKFLLRTPLISANRTGGLWLNLYWAHATTASNLPANRAGTAQIPGIWRKMT